LNSSVLRPEEAINMRTLSAFCVRSDDCTIVEKY
jgi:hypothetical protein